MLGSCSKYLDINTDPATPQVADPKSLTIPIFSAMARGSQYDARFLGLLIQNWGYYSSGYWAEGHGWTAGSDNAGEIWRQHYYGLGNNLNLIMEGGENSQQYNYVGLAKAVQAWSWQITTDYHGEIILDQAFDDTRYVFDYDSQEKVYTHVIDLTNEAISYLSRTDGVGTESALSVSDQAYKGSMAKWIKFCYGILARNAHNVWNKSTYDPDKVIEYVDKSLSSNADNFLVPNDGLTTTNSNFFGPMRDNMLYFRQSTLIVNLLNGLWLTGDSTNVIDPRRATMITASTDGIFRGVNPGSGDPNRTTTNSLTIANPWGLINTANPGAGNGKYLFKDKATFPIMTYAEMQFIKSEAAFRKGDKDLALSSYLNGVNASLDFVNALATTPITTTDRAAYLASKSVAQNTTELTLTDILLQKYIALWGYGFVETWSDLRRYHYNVGDAFGNNPYHNVFIFPSFASDNGGKPAYRYRPRYNSEYLWNIEALKVIGADQPDYHTYEMWFSKSE